MGIFNWQPPSPGDSVGISPYAWIYWVVAISATLLTLIVWASWIRAQGRRQRPEEVEKRDHDAEAKFRDRVARERLWVENGMRSGKGTSVVDREKDNNAFDLSAMQKTFWGDDDEKPRMRRKSRSRSQSANRRGNGNGYADV
jgi:hypothetical protein